MAETEPLPLEPATWMTSQAAWGSPSCSHNARIRSSLNTVFWPFSTFTKPRSQE